MNKMNCKSKIHDLWILLFGECRKCKDDNYKIEFFGGI